MSKPVGTTDVELGAYYEAFIDRQIASGRYADASEVARAALSLLEAEERARRALCDQAARVEARKPGSSA